MMDSPLKKCFRKVQITMSKLVLKKISIIVFFSMICCLTLIFYLRLKYSISTLQYVTSPLINHQFEDNLSTTNYLIDTPKCKIPSIEPLIEEVETFYNNQKYIPGSNKEPLTYIEKQDNFVTLNINQSLLSSYSFFKIYCCYSKISSSENSKEPDNELEIGQCNIFFQSVKVEDFVIMVKCKNIFFQEVYSNVHAIINSNQPNANSRMSVLLVGINSVSQQDLIRAMPKTYNFLEENDFINLKGYMKIGFNTLSTFLGMLTGQTVLQVKDSLNNCPFLWNQFKKQKYLTAYAEDTSNMSTFNNEIKGFQQPPTDFYFRSYILAAQKLKTLQIFEPEGERIINLVKDFQITLKNYPKFGLFWINSFNVDNLPMDKKIEEFLTDIYKNLDNSIFFFFSDHRLEDQMPFFYIHVPESFKKKYPHEYRNLEINSRRITNAFDIYMTLQHILNLANPEFVIEKSLACPKCQSIFKEISEDRTCEDAAIAQNFCVCNSPNYVSSKIEIVKRAALFLVNEINNLVQSLPGNYRCHYYQFGKVTYSGISQYNNTLLLRIKTKPKAVFEALVALEHTFDGVKSEFRITGEVSRLDKYTKCVKDSKLEKYCVCKNK